MTPTGATVCVLVTGDPVPGARQARGSFADMIARVAPAGTPFEARDARAEALPDLDRVSALIITGSAASVTERAPWMLSAEAYLRHAVATDVPILGICFGHQLLGQALGGRVAQNPKGREMGTVEYREAVADPVVSDPTRPYLCNMSHVDSVVELPPGAKVLGSTEREAHAALRFAPRVWGVQFHPEFDELTMRAYVDARRDALQREGVDPDQVMGSVRPQPAGAGVVARFLRTL